MTALWARLAGMALLALAGAGGGWSLYRRRLVQWQTVAAFVRLLDALRDTVYYRALPCEEALARAAETPAFAPFRLEHCRSFDQITLPPVLEKSCGPELREGLASLAAAPRDSACRTLSALSALCRRVGEDCRQQAEQTRRLAPRLGGCLGLLAAILLA